jgi:hypothetical protein
VEHPLGGEVVMSKRSGRRAANIPGFESLEGRSLLSSFSGPMGPYWMRSPGTQNSPSAMVAMLSGNSPGQCGSLDVSSTPGPSTPGSARPPMESVPDPADRAGAPPSPATVPFEQGAMSTVQPGGGGSSATPSGGSPAGQPASAETDPGGQAIISPAFARPSESAIGLGFAHVGKTVGSPDIAVAVAPGADPSAPSPPAPSAADDPAAVAPPLIGSSSARSALISLGITALTGAITAEWAIQSSPLRDAEQAAPPLVVAQRIESPHEPAAIVLANFPAPRGAGLITDLATREERQLEDCLSRLFDRSPWSNEPSDHLARPHPYLVEVALALVTVELARRWRRRPTLAPRPSRRSRFIVLSSLL